MPAFFVFGPFAFDPEAGRLWRGAQVVPLPPKPAALLQYFLTHPDRVLSKAELFEAVWPGTHTTDGVLRVTVRALRQALGEAVQAPQLLETVGRQGYRWLGGTATGAVPLGASAPSQRRLVGRQRELGQLQQALVRTLEGTRQLVLVEGEAGIGKTALVEAFVARLAPGGAVRVGRGQCLELYGAEEPYRPLLEVLEHLGRGADGAAVREIVQREAPQWLAQLPGFVNDEETLRVLWWRIQGATQARMVRELRTALEALSQEQPLLLVLEDLHWSDAATLDALAALASRREPARLLIVGTYRTEVAGGQLRTVQEIVGHDICTVLRLGPLSRADVTAYVAGRVGAESDSSALAALFYTHTDGHPLFLVHLLDYLVQQGLVEHQGGQWQVRGDAGALTTRLPPGVQVLLAEKIERLPPEAQRVLEAASVVGVQFTVAAVAAALEADEMEVEAICDTLTAPGRCLEEADVEAWPDGTLSGRYRFRHVLLQQTAYARLGAMDRVRLHRRIAERLEKGYGPRAVEAAGELAVHFEAGREPSRAVYYRQRAAMLAVRRYAYREAMAHARHGLALLAALPDTPEHTRLALALQMALGTALTATKGYAAPEVGEVYHRAWALCERLEDAAQRFSVLVGLERYAAVSGSLQTAHDLATQLLHLARDQSDPAMLLTAHLAMGRGLYWLGDCATAHPYLEHALVRTGAQQSGASPWVLVHPQVLCPLYAALVLWQLGWPDQARARMHEALRQARTLGHSFSLAFVLGFATRLFVWCGEHPTAQTLADELRALSVAQSFTHFEAMSTMWQCWLRVMQGADEAGLGLFHQGWEQYQHTGMRLTLPYFLALLAEVYGTVGQAEAGCEAVETALALVAQTGERWWEAELHRLRGELVLAQSGSQVDAATACFQEALTVAGQQGAKSLELRAATSLARLWQSQDKCPDAYELLAPVYAWFTEGFDTADLQDAKALLDALV